jgi:hypothetical protein
MTGAVVITLAGIAVFLGLPSALIAPGRSPIPSGSVVPGRGAVPSQIDGLEVLSVAAALGRQAAGSSERIAVFGWAVRFFVPCPQPPDAYQPLENCVYRFTWLMAAPEQLNVTNPDGSGSIHPPAGPAFNTTFDPLEPGVPQAVIVIGRFNDPGSARCPAGARRDACARLFVAEGAAWLGPTSSGPPATSPGTSVGVSPASVPLASATG